MHQLDQLLRNRSIGPTRGGPDGWVGFELGFELTAENFEKETVLNYDSGLELPDYENGLDHQLLEKGHQMGALTIREYLLHEISDC